MKGVIFNIFSEFIEDLKGIETWDKILEETGQNGVYTSAGSYPDADLFSLVGKTCEILDLELSDALKAFGQYAVKGFHLRYPKFFENINWKEFFQSIHGVIHKEVIKLYPGATPPEIIFEEGSNGRITLHYRSERCLPDLAEGLILGTISHFDIKADLIRHDKEGETIFELVI